MARSYLTAGVALVGAGAIAVSPINPVNPLMAEPHASTITVSHAAVDLAASVDPITRWIQVFANTADSLGVLAQAVIADPAPILTKLAEAGVVSAQALIDIVEVIAQGFAKGVAETPAAFETAFQMIRSGDFTNGVPFLFNAALTPILQAFFPVVLGPSLPNLVSVLQNPFDNISRAISTGLPTALGLLGFPLLGIPLTIAGQIGASIQEVVNSIGAGDFGSAVNAILNFPADLVDSFLNGNQALSLNGLLSPFGIVDGFLNWKKGIAAVLQPPTIITPPPALAADEVPGPAAFTVNLSTETVAKDQDSTDTQISGAADSLSAETPPPVEATPVVTEPTVEEPPAEEPTAPVEDEEPAVTDDDASAPDDTESDGGAPTSGNDDDNDAAGSEKSYGAAKERAAKRTAKAEKSTASDDDDSSADSE